MVKTNANQTFCSLHIQSVRLSVLHTSSQFLIYTVTHSYLFCIQDGFRTLSKQPELQARELQHCLKAVNNKSSFPCCGLAEILFDIYL